MPHDCDGTSCGDNRRLPTDKLWLKTPNQMVRLDRIIQHWWLHATAPPRSEAPKEVTLSRDAPDNRGPEPGDVVEIDLEGPYGSIPYPGALHLLGVTKETQCEQLWEIVKSQSRTIATLIRLLEECQSDPSSAG